MLGQKTEDIRLKTVDTRLITLKDDPRLRYGLVSSKGSAVLFTDMLDMALVKKWSGDEGLVWAAGEIS